MPNIMDEVEKCIDTYISTYLNKSKIDLSLDPTQSKDIYSIKIDGSNCIVYGDWNKYSQRSSILDNLNSAIYHELYPRFNVRYDRCNTASSAGAIVIWDANEKLPGRYKRLLVVLKPYNHVPVYQEAEITFCEALNRQFKKQHIESIDFIERNNNGSGYGLSCHHILEAVHVGGNNKKSDVYIRTSDTINPVMKISLKLSNAEFVSKERAKIQKMLDLYYVVSNNSNGDLVITHRENGNSIEIALCPITGKMILPKRVYLHIPNNKLLSNVLFGEGDEEVDCVLTLPESIYSIATSVNYGGNNKSFSYVTESVLSKSDINKLSDTICICLRNADKGRMGLQVEGEFNSSILPTVVFSKDRAYSIPI